MNRGDLSDLNTFLAIADHLSFRAARSDVGACRTSMTIGCLRLMRAATSSWPDQ